MRVFNNSSRGVLVNIEIMSRTKMREFSFHAHDEKIAVISISDVDKTNPELHNNPENGIFKLFQVRFADVEIGEPNCITDEQANEIAEFVVGILDSADKIVVHCEAGVSRSAGVGAALMKFIKGYDWDVFDKPRFCPNMTCYRKVLNALGQGR